MFQQDYETLNENQRRVVEQTRENLLVLAPAGTGKTKVMAMRVAKLISQQIAPEHILCLTFTNKAAKEMKERIALYVPKESHEIVIRTFHSFCYYLICHEKNASHVSFPCTIMDESDALHVLKKAIHSNGLNDDQLYYPHLLTFIEEVKRHALTFEVSERYEWGKIIKSYLQNPMLKFYKSEPFIRKWGERLFKGYNRYLKENNAVDFMDLVLEAFYLLEQEEILKKWQGRFQAIQVDEMQDTSTREYELIKKLAIKGNLSLFGDFNQTIYEWRGSQPQSMIAAYKEDFAPEEIRLGLNYRSTKILLEAANAYIKTSQLYPSLCKAYSVIEGEPITLLEARHEQEELDMLVRSVKASKGRTDKLAVLTRTNQYAKRISEAFNKEGIACTVIEDTKLFRKKEVKEILAFFEYAVNERNNHALQKILEHPAIQLPDWLVRELKSTKECGMYLHDWFKIQSQDPYTPLMNAYEQSQIVVLDVESTGLSTTSDDIIQIAAICYGKEGVKRQLDVLVRPTQSVGESYHVHGFTDEQLQAEGVSPREALEALQDFVQGCILVGHNVNYDLQIINSMMTRYQMPPLEGTVIYDTLDLAYKVYPKLTNHKLETLASLLETVHQPNHNALYDILATSEVLTHLLMQLMTQKQERLEKIEAYYCYVEEYKNKLGEIMAYLKTHSVEEGIIFLMNNHTFKNYYNKDELESLRALYRIVQTLYDKQLSYQDNQINLLAFSALHYSEMEQSELFQGRIPIITIHQAKGLEFEEVYVAGCNDGTFPSYRSKKDKSITEEMRLFYVAMTRAQKRLYLSYHLGARQSMFLDQIPSRYKIIKNYSES